MGYEEQGPMGFHIVHAVSRLKDDIYIYIHYYRRWPLYLGLSVFWLLEPETICRFPGTICRVPGTICKKHAVWNM